MYRPSELYYAQDSIHYRFRDGRTLDSSLRELLKHKRPQDYLPRIDVMVHAGKHFVVDGNRRLYLLKMMESAGIVDVISVNEKIFNSLYFNRKHTTENGGVSVRIRRDSSMEYTINRIINQHKRGNPPVHQSQMSSASCSDFASMLNVTPRRPIIQSRDVGNFKQGWVIKDIPMTPAETARKLCQEYGTNEITTANIVHNLVAEYSAKSIFEHRTTKLGMKFCHSNTKLGFCDLELEEREGSYNDLYESVKELHSKF